MDADGGAEELRQVGRHRDRLRLDPEEERHPARELLAADLGQVPLRRDPSFADSVWISIAIRFAATITQTSV